MSLDAPDWQRVVTAVETVGAVPDAPDWQRIVVGPGGGAINITGAPSWASLYVSAGYIGVPVSPLSSQNAINLNGGPVNMQAFTALFTGPVHSVAVAMRNGQPLTANENFVGIYDFGQTTANTMTLLAQSAAGVADPIWASSGTTPVPLSTNPTLTAGQTYMVATLNNGNTLTAYGPGQSAGGVANPLFSTYPWFCDLSGPHTTLPGTIAFSAVSESTAVIITFIE